MAKGYGLSIKYVLYDMSYANMIMYSAVIPSYNSEKGNSSSNDSKTQETIKADDPRNKARIRQILDSMD